MKVISDTLRGRRDGPIWSTAKSMKKTMSWLMSPIFIKANANQPLSGLQRLPKLSESQLECQSCRKCHEICPSNCIKLNEKNNKVTSISINLIDCSFCNLCVEVCDKEQFSFNGDELPVILGGESPLYELKP